MSEYDKLKVSVIFPEAHARSSNENIVKIEHDYLHEHSFRDGEYIVNLALPDHRARDSVDWEPIVRDVKEDIHSVQDLFDTIREEFVSRREYLPIFSYILEPSERANKYRVYNESGDEPFRKLERIKNTDHSIMPVEYRDICELAKSVHVGKIGNDSFYSVQGDSLREATSNIISTYRNIVEIKNIPPEILI